jgi:hypothetical protein
MNAAARRSGPRFSPQGRWNQVTPEEVRVQLRHALSRWGRPEYIRVDNGSPWGSKGDFPTELAMWLIGLGIGMIWNTPRRPQGLRTSFSLVFQGLSQKFTNNNMNCTSCKCPIGRKNARESENHWTEFWKLPWRLLPILSSFSIVMRKPCPVEAGEGLVGVAEVVGLVESVHGGDGRASNPRRRGVSCAVHR